MIPIPISSGQLISLDCAPGVISAGPGVITTGAVATESLTTTGALGVLHGASCVCPVGSINVQVGVALIALIGPYWLAIVLLS